MRWGIVGSEQAKFTSITEAKARQEIKCLLGPNDSVISGECHLGGIDIYAKEIALELGLEYIGYPPMKLQWEGGYKQRNIQIAQNSDIVVCITVRRLPSSYKGMKFNQCYHCPADSEEHIKSGGCWTMKVAKSLRKDTRLIVID
jgi:hypothetical protein